MISIDDAFKKFKSRLELNDQEQKDASRRQKEIRAIMDEAFSIECDFLTGSYARWTKTKPLKDVDIFCVLSEKERHYRDEHPSSLLSVVEQTLVAKYGQDRVYRQRRSVTVELGVTEEDALTNSQVMSFDVVPAFSRDDYYEIPDVATTSGWTKTNPRIHYDKAVAAQDAFADEWKGIVRMVKKWNSNQGKPITPSFLIEVMALKLLYPPYCGDYRREIQAFFMSLADHIHEIWPDPAGLGPAVSDRMDAQQCHKARIALLDAEKQAALTIRLEGEGKNGEALQAWRTLFGPLFPLS